MDIQQTPFLRELASSDRKTRDKALDSLSLFIKSRRDLDLLELLKIWKGLFFCMYHSDRPITQQGLARALSYTLVPSVPKQTLHRFLRAFWITMSRDFHSLDRLRLDKYLYLIRCYVGVAFSLFLSKGLSKQEAEPNKKKGKAEAKNKKDKEGSSKKRKRGDENDGADNNNEDESYSTETWHDLQLYLDMLEEGPLCPYNFIAGEPNNSTSQQQGTDMPKGPDGLRYHILDIWVDEIEKVATDTVTVVPEAGSEGEEDMEEEARTKLKDGVPMELLLRPIQRLKEEGAHKTLRKKAAAALDDERLVEWGVVERMVGDEDEEEEGEDDEWGGIDA